MSDTYQTLDQAQENNPIDFMRRRAQSLAVAHADASPDNAARALKLSETTGMPPAAVDANLDAVDSGTRGAMSSEIVGQSSHLQEYINSHPLAVKVSNDDWHNLSGLSDKLQKVISLPSDIGWNIVKAGFKGYMEDLGDKAWGSWADDPKLNWYFGEPGTNRWGRTINTVLGMPVEMFLRGASALPGGVKGVATQAGIEFGMAPSSAESMGRELAAMTEWGMTRGDIPLGDIMSATSNVERVQRRLQESGKMRSALTPLEREQVRLQETVDEHKYRQALSEFKRAYPYLAEGREPPVGISKTVDDIKAEQAKSGIEALDEATKATSQASTLERSPEMTEAFIGLRAKGNISINAEAVAKLYGEKVPAPGDGILGDVQGLDHQLRLAQMGGGDIEISTKQWLVIAAQNPELAKALKEHIRPYNGGVTLDEVKIAKEQEAAKVEPPAGAPEPYSSGDLAVDSTRQAAAVDKSLIEREIEGASATPEARTSESAPSAAEATPHINRRGTTQAEKPSAKQLSLPDITRMEDREAFARAAAMGLDARRYKAFKKLIDEKNAADKEAQLKKQLALEKKRQTPEWKANEDKVREEVKVDFATRPDVAADEFLRSGKYGGQKLEQHLIDPSFLTPEQRKLLPEKFMSKDGMPPDDVARLFDFETGDDLVQRVHDLVARRDQEGSTPKEFLNKLIKEETAQRMEARFGGLEESMLKEAKEHVFSPTQLDILSQDTIRMAEKAGAELPLTGDVLRRQMRDEFGDIPLKYVNSDKAAAETGRKGRAAEMDLLTGKPGEALKKAQEREKAAIATREAIKLENQIEKFKKRAKRLSARDQSGRMPQEYGNWIHDILNRTYDSGTRGVQDLRTEIDKSGQKTLQEFVDHKITNYGRDIPIEDFLLATDEKGNPTFAKNFEDLTVNEFRAVDDAITTLEKQGRDEKKLIWQGDEADLGVKKAEIIEQFKTFKEKPYVRRPGRLQKFGRWSNTGLINVETFANRWDRDNVKGPWNQWLVRPMSDGANYKSRLDREFSVPYRDLGKIVDKDKQVSSPLLDPRSVDKEGNFTKKLSGGLTRENVATMISNSGNPYNMRVLFKGYGLDETLGLDWLIRNSAKADWVRAEKMGKIFGDAYELDRDSRRNATGVAPAKIDLEPFEITFPNGEKFKSDGWYHPIIEDKVLTPHVRGPEAEAALDKKRGINPAIPSSYTKERTGQIKPLSLDYDMIPAKLNEILHSVAFRQPIMEAAKLTRDKGVRGALRDHYGKEYVDMLDNWLMDVAHNSTFDSEVWGKFTQVSNFVRTATIGKLIGLNVYTVMKHGPTALVNSMYEAGAKNFIRSFGDTIPARYYREATQTIFGKNAALGEEAWDFAMRNSEELQRRVRHWQETVAGQHANVYDKPGKMQWIVQQGARPVAFSDLLSAVPTWSAVFNHAIDSRESVGQAIFAANRAVRRAHGSTAITNQPALVRGGGPLNSWLTTLYGFFGTQMQRRAELAFEIHDMYKLGREGELKKAMANVPKVSGLLFASIIWPTIIEEVVAHVGTDDRRGLLEKLTYGALGGLSSSVLYARDFMHGFISDKDPAAGLISTPMHDFRNLTHDLKMGGKMFSRQHAGKMVDDFIQAFGDVSGIPGVLGHTARFTLDTMNRVQHPRSPQNYFLGATRGQMKPRIEK